MTGVTVTAARIIAGIGTVECSAVAASVLTHTDGPTVSRLPASPALWIVVFMVGAVLLAFAASSGYPRAIVFTFGGAASVHAAIAFALIGQGIIQGTGWVAGTLAGMCAAMYAVEALRIARVWP